MTLKKFNKSLWYERKQIKHLGQSIFEYFILTTFIVTVVLFFVSSPYFKAIKNSCLEAFNQAVEDMLR
jgi:hypothetical protein